jgi:hypothetical protein
MSLTLEKVKQPTKAITRGTKLFCYIDSYGFRKGFKYHVYNIINGDIIVKDRDNIEVIFNSVAELKGIFMIMED